MDSREQWQALQSSFREARVALAAGDRALALEAVQRALAIDPSFLAAQVFRDRLLAASEQPPSPVAAPVAAPAEERSSQTAAGMAEGLARFEERVKRRRVQRRLEAAREAISESRLLQASAAVEELRDLNPGLSELPELTRAIEQGRPSRRAPGGHLGVVAAVFAGIILLASPLQDEPAPRADTTRELPVVMSMSSPPLPPEAPAPIFRPVELPAPPRLDRANRRSAPPPPTVEATRRTIAEAGPPAPPVAASEIRAPLTAPVAETEENAGLAVVSPAVPEIDPAIDGQFVANGGKSVAMDEQLIAIDEQLVLKALQQYRWAYGDLNAASAVAVWPTVDRAALARAFDGLASQALTFQDCSVRMNGQAATATCVGTARYVPKVGSREPRIEPRRWSFSLRKQEDAWQIENARAER